MSESDITTGKENYPVVNTDSILQKFKAGEIAVKTIDRLAQNLTISSTNLYFEKSLDLVDWKGNQWLQNIAQQGRSCIVVGEDGIGKSTAMIVAEDADDNESGIHYILPSPGDTSEIFKDLWDKLGRPLPEYTQFAVRSDTWKRIYKCNRCQRACEFYSNWPDKDFDIDVGFVIDKCLLIMDQVCEHLEQLNDTIVVRISDLDTDLINLFKQMLQHDLTVVILANHEQVKILKKHEIFRRLPQKRFPRPTPEFFFKLAATLLKNAELDITPISPNALVLITLLSRFNPGKYVSLLSQILDEMRCEQPIMTIDIEFVVRTIAEAWDEETMIIYALSKYQGKHVKVERLCSIISETFGKIINDGSLGRKLKNVYGLTSRRNNGSEIKVPDSIHMLPYGL
ncbi:hypothetical protein ACFLUD_01010 [Chloroflexota bacterium]